MQSSSYLRAKPRPGAMLAVITVHAVGIGALMLFAPTIVETLDSPLEGYNVPALTVPPERADDPVPNIKDNPAPPVNRVKRQVEIVPAETGPALLGDPGPLSGAGTGEHAGGGFETVAIDPISDPVIVGPRLLGRNAQPPYPPGMQRLSIDGVVTVRVLVGIDGRPLRIEAVKVDQDAFFAATRDWGMKYWRFAPATRDGEPFEEWRTMTVRFEMN